MFNLPRHRQAALIAWDMHERGEMPSPDRRPVLADGVRGSAEAAGRLAAFQVGA